MISDILFEAEEAINSYLEHDGTRPCYQDPEILAEIAHILGRMRALRARLDNPMTPEEQAAIKAVKAANP